MGRRGSRTLLYNMIATGSFNIIFLKIAKKDF